MKKIYFFILSMFFFFSIKAQDVAIISGAAGAQGTSGNVIVGANAFHALEAIYTETEIGAGNFESSGTSINRVGFYVSTPGTPTLVTTFKVYMKNEIGRAHV